MASSTFYDNQKKTGTTIVQHFTHGNYAILWALCQSGKSGTFHWVARQMLELGRCKRVYILCGSAEVCLREQAFKDLLDYNADHALKIQVIFRTSFKKSHMIIKDSLIIIDESHLDQTKGMELDIFLQRHGLNLTGNCATLTANNCHILSVSATPYAEIAALKAAERREEPVHKAIVHLPPGEGYVGIERFLAKKRIAPTFPITGKTVHDFARFMRDPEFRGKYCIMRVKNGAAARAIKAAQKLGGYALVSYTAESTGIAITKAERDARVEEIVKSRLRSAKYSEAIVRAKAQLDHPWLGEPPMQTTVILLKERLRAGKVVPKEHIGFVWEDATTSKTDTLVQGLLGRMCGYYKPGQYVPKIFLPLKVIEEHEGCVMPQSELARAISWEMLPREFAHACAARRSKDLPKTQCVPIRLPSVAEGREFFNRGENAYNRETKGLCLTALRALYERGSSQFGAFTDEQLEEVGSILEAPPRIALRHIQSKEPSRKTDDWFNMLLDGHMSRTSLHGLHMIADTPELTFFIVYDDYEPCAELKDSMEKKFVPGEAYAVFYTEAKGKLEALDYKHRFSCTDEKELYSLGEAPLPTIWESSVPAFTGRFNRICFEDPELLTNEMRKVLNSGLDIRCLEDVERGFFAFRKAAFAYKTPEDNELVRICIALGLEVGMTIHVDFKPRLVRKTDPATETVHVRKISWSKAI